ncbi:MAG: hypothetical protein AAF485_05100, partial [Chloroflexota bacterium]
MIFLTPSPAFWDDPGPLPYKKLYRRCWRLSGQPFFEPRREWIDRLMRNHERYMMWLDQQREYELMMAAAVLVGTILGDVAGLATVVALHTAAALTATTT